MDIINGILFQLQSLFLHPMLYLGILLIILQYRKQIAFERKLFSARLHSLPLQMARAIGYGIIGGIVASILMFAFGIVFNPEYIWIIWLLTGVLILFNVRFLCLSYSVGILGFFAGIIQLFAKPLAPFFGELSISWLNNLFNLIVNIDIPSLVAIVAVLHIIEAFLIKLQSAKQATPLFVESKRGKLIGGYHVQSFWILPLFIMVSTGDSGGGLLFSFTWPFSGANSEIVLMPAPVMIGYSDLTSVYSPEVKSNKSANYLIVYSLLLLSMAYVATIWAPFQIFAALFAGIGHELVRVIGRRDESKLPAKYVHPLSGLMILAVIPGSLAEKLELKAGEIIKRVNGFEIKNRQDLYRALQAQPAFVKLEIINLAGHVKFAQHSIYAGEHHQLGIILAPDDEAPYLVEMDNMNLWKLLKQKVTKTSRSA